MTKNKKAGPGLAVAICTAALLAALLAGCNDFWHDLAYVPAKTPRINSQPQDTAVTVGGSATLAVSVTVSDGGALSYQWYGSLDSSNSGGSLISGNGNTARYTPPTDTAGTFYYYVVVTNSKNGTTAAAASNAAKVEVNDRVNAAVPQITAQPQGAAYTTGATAAPLAASAAVSGGGVLTYQWYSHSANNNTDGAAIGGATTNTYTPPTDTAGTAWYYVVVTGTIADNGDGGAKTAAAASTTAKIEVNDKVHAAVPRITAQPQGKTDYLFNAAAITPLTVSASINDGGTVTYQWYRNTSDSNEGGSPISGADTAGYTPPVPGTPGQPEYYYAVVTNTIADNGDGGAKSQTAASGAAAIMRREQQNAGTPSISVQPAGNTYLKDSAPAALSVTAADAVSGGIKGAFSYQWYSNSTNSNTSGIPIDTETGAACTPPTSTAGDTWYYVVVTNTITDNGDGGAKTAFVTSDAAKITVYRGTGGAEGSLEEWEEVDGN